MSDATMQVELVAADRLVWSGEARMVIARTTEGDVGILPNHAPMLSLMVDGVVDVTTADDETWIAAVDAGFLSVAGNRISILAEHAEMAHDIDLEKARHDLERARETGEDGDDAAAEAEEKAARAWAEARVRAAEKRS
jgi:F-type H+-transporting ATPase subunit epsilon